MTTNPVHHATGYQRTSRRRSATPRAGHDDTDRHDPRCTPHQRPPEQTQVAGTVPRHSGGVPGRRAVLLHRDAGQQLMPDAEVVRPRTGPDKVSDCLGVHPVSGQRSPHMHPVVGQQGVHAHPDGRTERENGRGRQDPPGPHDDGECDERLGDERPEQRLGEPPQERDSTHNADEPTSATVLAYRRDTAAGGASSPSGPRRPHAAPRRPAGPRPGRPIRSTPGLRTRSPSGGTSSDRPWGARHAPP